MMSAGRMHLDRILRRSEQVSARWSYMIFDRPSNIYIQLRGTSPSPRILRGQHAVFTASSPSSFRPVTHLGPGP